MRAIGGSDRIEECAASAFALIDKEAVATPGAERYHPAVNLDGHTWVGGTDNEGGDIAVTIVVVLATVVVDHQTAARHGVGGVAGHDDGAGGKVERPPSTLSGTTEGTDIDCVAATGDKRGQGIESVGNGGREEHGITVGAEGIPSQLPLGGRG